MVPPSPPLTPLQGQLLRVLTTISDLNASELSVALGRSRSHLATVLRGLERRGLVRISPGRSERGAVMHLYALTPAGQRAADGNDQPTATARA